MDENLFSSMRGSGRGCRGVCEMMIRTGTISEVMVEVD